MKTHHVRAAHKHRSSLLLIVLLLAVLVACWLLSLLQSHRAPGFIAKPDASANIALADGMTYDTEYTMPKKIDIVRTAKKNKITYTGSFVVPNCDTFSTSLLTPAAGSASVSLAFVVAKTSDACSDVGTSSTPFTLSYSLATTSTANTPKLTDIRINNQPVPFSVK